LAPESVLYGVGKCAALRGFDDSLELVGVDALSRTV